jgi:hypothetical protein
MKRMLGTALLFAGLTVARGGTGIRYVDADAAGANDGTSWANAFSDLQDALAAALPGDELLVCAGVYTPGPPDDAVSSFVLRNNVALYGGFFGYETAREQRDWSMYASVLSGDVGRDDVYGNPWYQGWNIHTANSGHVVDGSGVDGTAILDGFLITAGHTGPVGTPAGDPLMYGSGLYLINGSPTVRNCTFSRNLAAFAAGGAIYCYNSAPSIVHCRFVQNYVHLGNGAGIAVVGNAVPSIADCTFAENRAVADGGNTGQGAGLSINFLTAPLSIAVERCLFEQNVAITFFPAGGVEIARGGGISNFGATLTVRDCIFRNNSANAGAGIQTWDPATIVNCLLHNNMAYSHDFGAGSDGGYGAGICIYSFQPDVVSVINCTVVNNTGGEGVGMQSLANAELTVRNTIIWGNIANGQDVAPRDAGIRGSYTAQYSCIQDLLTPVPGEDPPDPENYPGCIVVSPRLVGGGDHQLAADSPCIDAGQNSVVPIGVTTDLDGLPRFYDDPLAPDVGQGTPPLVDMGCYERQPPPCAGDVNGDRVVDLTDLATLLSHYGMPSGATPGDGDLDGDGDVDLNDLAVLLSRFGAACP